MCERWGLGGLLQVWNADAAEEPGTYFRVRRHRATLASCARKSMLRTLGCFHSLCQLDWAMGTQKCGQTLLWCVCEGPLDKINV